MTRSLRALIVLAMARFNFQRPDGVSQQFITLDPGDMMPSQAQGMHLVHRPCDCYSWL